MLLLAYVISFLIGVYIALSDLFNSTSLYFAFARRSLALWVLGAIYGIFAVVFLYLLSEYFIRIEINSTVFRRPIGDEALFWVYVIFCGISIKSLLNISFYNVRMDGKSFPIGLATLVRIFEPQLKKSIETDHYIAFDTFLTHAEAKTVHLSLMDIHNVIRNQILTRFEASEVSAFLLDLASRRTVRESYIFYLRAYGKKMFCHTFPMCREPSWWNFRRTSGGFSVSA